MNRREFSRSVAGGSSALAALAVIPGVAAHAAEPPMTAAGPFPELLEEPEYTVNLAPNPQRQVEIVFERGGRFVAQLYVDEAPLTTAYFLKRLPFTLPARRAVMSGGIIGVNLEGWNLNTLEWVNTMIPEGELGFLTTHLPHRPMNNPYCQLLLPLGERSMVHQMWGAASPTNRMGKIVEGSLSDLRAVGSRIANTGPESITVRRVGR